MTDPELSDEESAQLRAIFGRPDPDPDPDVDPDAKRRGNVVPKEGRHIPKPVDPDAEMRQFARELFGYPAD